MSAMLRLSPEQLKAHMDRMAKSLPVRRITKLDAHKPVVGGDAAIKANKAWIKPKGRSKGEEGLEQRKCVSCGVSFTPKRIGERHKGKYCGKQCTGKDKLKVRVCQHCGEQFKSLTNENLVYCSDACKHAHQVGSNNPCWRGGKVDVECEVCGKKESVFPALAYKRFCSRKCFGISKSLTSVGENNPNWRNATKAVQCASCGKETVGRVGRVYCSKDCFNVGEFSTRTAGRWKTSWGMGNKKAGKRADLNNQFFRSAWEANYARYLNLLIGFKNINKWEFEAETFEFAAIKKGTRFYTPDFRVTLNDGKIEYHEVKGWKHPKGETALRRMAKYFPDKKIILIDKKVYEGIKRTSSRLIPSWE